MRGGRRRIDRQKLRYDLKRRPISIIAKIKTPSEEQVIVVPQTTPMDNILGDGVDSVTLSSGGRSVSLTAETRRNAEQMLRGVARPDRVTAPQAGDENLFEDED